MTILIIANPSEIPFFQPSYVISRTVATIAAINRNCMLISPNMFCIVAPIDVTLSGLKTLSPN